MPFVLIEVAEQYFSEVERVLAACRLKGDVDLPVLAHMVDIARQAVTTVEGLEDLVLIDLALVLIVDDDLEAQVGLLPDEDVSRGAVSKARLTVILRIS